MHLIISCWALFDHNIVYRFRCVSTFTGVPIGVNIFDQHIYMQQHLQFKLTYENSLTYVQRRLYAGIKP